MAWVEEEGEGHIALKVLNVVNVYEYPPKKKASVSIACRSLLVVLHVQFCQHVRAC